MTLFHSTSKSVRQLLVRLLQRTNSGANRRRLRNPHQRHLRTELLETRQLLAADLQLLQHNRFDPEDVNDDGLVSAIDALMVINTMNGQASQERNGFVDVNDDGLASPLDALLVINRVNRGGKHIDRARPRDEPVPNLPQEYRTIDGTGNNLIQTELGSTGEALLRFADADYSDGISSPAGVDRPSAREISNALAAADPEGTHSNRGLSAFIYVWGQFIDHDIDLTESQVNGESFAIEVPAGDPLFDPSNSGTVTIPLARSEFDPTTGTSIENPRQQISSITAFIDGSMVYGSDQITADNLRTFDGGRLRISDSGLLATDADGEVLAGDIRAGENISLTAVQTLFVREHNRLADRISEANQELSDEEIYQQARAVVIAEIQAITYNEFLPALLGTRTISRYQGYDSSVDPTIANEFSTAAFRFGHSTLNDDVGFFDNEGRDIRDEISLADAFHNASLLEEVGIDSLLKYEASVQAQEVDLQVVDSLRNFLFGAPGAGGLDLAALNIQRGRDHGLADYNATRAAYGLNPASEFAEVTSDVELQGKLESLYGDVGNIDLWVGLLAEDHVRGASVGELTQTIIADQFERIRDGDRFWYENQYRGAELRQLQSTTLADVIERNSTVRGLQDNVFFMVAEVSGQVSLAGNPSISNTGRPSTNPENAGRPIEGRPGGGGNTGSQGVPGVRVELLNEDGEVLDSTVTDQRGNYRFQFSAFAETGDYQIRLAESKNVVPVSNELVEILISNGKTRLRGLDFEVSLL